MIVSILIFNSFKFDLNKKINKILNEKIIIKCIKRMIIFYKLILVNLDNIKPARLSIIN